MKRRPWLVEHYSAKGSHHYRVGAGRGVHGLWFVSFGGFVPPDLKKGYRLAGRYRAFYHPKEPGTYRFWRASARREVSIHRDAFYAGMYDCRD
jgi:hypothetical protein